MPLIRTVKELCRVCYTCVRECPAKAIRIADGQAEIIRERCTGCGNCVRVCSQGAKQVVSSIPMVEMFVGSGEPTAAILAPSFAAEFGDLGYRSLVGMSRQVGFSWVNEVGFGADLVAAEYRKLLESDVTGRYVATSCPAIVLFVEKYHPSLVDKLAPIVSPMIATARVLRAMHGDGIRVVFIGPCIAKKSEAVDAHLLGEIDAVLTFSEFREMLKSRGINAENAVESEFDPPHAGLGSLFPVSRGLLQAASLNEDLVNGEVVTASGKAGFVPAIREFESGDMDARLLEVLACEGCIMGAGMTCTEPLFSRRTAVSRFVRERQQRFDHVVWERDMDRFGDLDLSRDYAESDQRLPIPSKDELKTILARIGKLRPEDELNCGACGYDTCVEYATAIYRGLAETEMCLPYTIEKLHRTNRELGVSNDKLASTQEALIQSEKLASMGQLAAGIAHEVNNPLSVVLMYSHLLMDEIDGSSELHEDLSLIAREADRCKKIVSGLLQFARQNKTDRKQVDMKSLVENSIRSVGPPDAIRVIVEHSMDDPIAYVDGDQVMQVLINLISNACDAMESGGVLTVRTGDDDGRVFARVSDTGAGIPEEKRKKIFEPFFTTKQIGEGTGLGLSVSYGIVKMHRGDITVESNDDPSQGSTGATFTVSLPRKGDAG
jgi:signal transduction histidine kinase/iron only hydrogenase large subunit-like protein